MPLPLSPILDTICARARAKDLNGLDELLIKEGICIDATFGRFTAIELLAREGNREAVDFLIERCGASRDLAVQGFAAGGYTAEVKRLLQAGASRCSAIQGFAEGNYPVELEALYVGADIKAESLAAIRGYSLGGHIQETVDLVSVNEEGRSVAIEGFALGGTPEGVNRFLQVGIHELVAIRAYAQGGHIEEVSKFPLTVFNGYRAALGFAHGGYDKEVDKILTRVPHYYYYATVCSQGYVEGGHIARLNNLYERYNNLRILGLNECAWGLHLNSKTILPLLLSIKSEWLKEYLAEKMQELNSSLSSTILLADASRIRAGMEEYGLNFPQAASLSTLGNRFWFLRGARLSEPGRSVKNERLPLAAITSFVTGLPQDEASHVHNEYPKFFMGLAGMVSKEEPHYFKELEVIEEAVDLVDEDLRRLRSFRMLDLLIWLGMLKSPAGKIAALQELQNIIEDTSRYQTREAIVVWATTHKEVMTEQRNVLHTFFKPTHTAKSQRGYEGVCTLFNIKEADLNRPTELSS